MSVLKFYGSRSDINQIISGEIDMPLTAAILKKEKVELHVLLNEKDDLSKILSNSEEPVNIRFMMDQVEIKIPIYSFIQENIKLPLSSRCVIIGECLSYSNPISMNLKLTNHDDKLLTGRFEKNFIKNNHFSNTWDSIFTQKEIESHVKFLIPKSNAIILNDSYLFSKQERNQNLGIRNLKQSLKVLLPEQSNEEFHITIITADCKWSPVIASEKFNELYDYLKNGFNYPIFLELVIWGESKSTNHKRILVSNYYTVTTDYGFDIFNSENKAHGNNDIVAKRIFHDVNQPGESPYLQSNLRIGLMLNSYKSAKNFCRNFRQGMGCIYLNSSSDFDKMNRLFIG
jgi:hypothetical protein